MVPDAMEDNLLIDYRPYSSPGDDGDLATAQEMMRQSRYDANGDGLCDAAECSNVPALARDVEPFTSVAEAVREDMAALGIMLDLSVVPMIPTSLRHIGSVRALRDVRAARLGQGLALARRVSSSASSTAPLRLAQGVTAPWWGRRQRN